MINQVLAIESYNGKFRSWKYIQKRENAFVFLTVLVFVMMFVMEPQAFSGEKKINTELRDYEARIVEALKVTRVNVGGNWITQDQLRTHLSEFMDIENKKSEVNHSFRWARPIRYYIEGLEQYEGLQEEFETILREVAALTELDIAPHNQIYWPRKGTDYHPDSPDHRFTNAIFMFTEDVEKLFRGRVVAKAYKLLKIDIDKAEKRWKEGRKMVVDGLSTYKTTVSKVGQIYYFAIEDFSEFSQFSKVERGGIIHNTAFGLAVSIVNRYSSNEIRPSHTNRGKSVNKLNYFNEFDRALLKAYYERTLLPIMKNEYAIEAILGSMWLIFVEQNRNTKRKQS